ncbi:MAG: DUF3048 domain-containing protein [Bacillota bacterium]
MKKSLRYIFILLAIGVLAVMSGCQKEEADTALRCPFDNQEISQMPTHLMVVTIDNAPNARPQSGLSQADLLYELPAEGGVSRILAVFYHGQADVIGPIRSARPYLIDVAKGWQAVYVHVGGSNDALSYLSAGQLPYINEFSYGKYFWRDQSRRAPHNLYTSSENLQQILTEKGWEEQREITAWPFLAEGQTQLSVAQEAEKAVDEKAADISLPEATEFSINYISAKNKYQYDAESNKYLRFVGGEPYIDASTGEQIAVSNVLVQYVSSQVLDREGRLSIDMTGEGKALLFSEGVVLEGRWLCDDLESRTKFVDQEGQEWRMSSGKTWIQVVDQTVKVEY